MGGAREGGSAGAFRAWSERLHKKQKGATHLRGLCNTQVNIKFPHKKDAILMTFTADQGGSSSFNFFGLQAQLLFLCLWVQAVLQGGNKAHAD
jgi:hypothetical protein